jgi:hypothetical protein
MNYHRKSQKRRYANHMTLVQRIEREVRKEEGVPGLVFPKHGPFEVHRRLVYEGLPLQPAVAQGDGIQLRNGMRIVGLKSLLNLISWSPYTMKDFQRQFAPREV